MEEQNKFLQRNKERIEYFFQKHQENEKQLADY